MNLIIVKKEKVSISKGFTPTPVLNKLSGISFQKLFANQTQGEGSEVFDKTGVSSAKAERGFTLVEILVSIAIFLVIMTISMGSVVTIMDANRKSGSLKVVMTNLNFALEIMSREIKFGDTYGCSISTCSSGDTTINFTSSDGLDTVYRLNSGRIEKSTNAGASFQTITAPEMSIQDLRFYIFGYNTGDGIQPRVLISVRGFSGTKPSSQSSFFLQTTVSQRILDDATGGLPPPPPPPPTSFSYVRLVVTKKKTAADDCSTGLGCIQMSELRLMQGGSDVTWPGGTTATNPGGNQSSGEGPQYALDGTTNTKWLDYNFAGADNHTGSSELIINMGSALTFDGYRWATANDYPSRDPVTWSIYGSNDGSNWTLLDSRSDESITDSRYTFTTFSF